MLHKSSFSFYLCFGYVFNDNSHNQTEKVHKLEVGPASKLCLRYRLCTACDTQRRLEILSFQKLSFLTDLHRNECYNIVFTFVFNFFL